MRYARLLAVALMTLLTLGLGACASQPRCGCVGAREPTPRVADNGPAAEPSTIKDADRTWAHWDVSDIIDIPVEGSAQATVRLFKSESLVAWWLEQLFAESPPGSDYDGFAVDSNQRGRVSVFGTKEQHRMIRLVLNALRNASKGEALVREDLVMSPDVGGETDFGELKQLEFDPP